MYTGRGKSNKGVGGIRAIRREISSNVELRSPLPLSPLSVKRCRGVGWRGIVPRKSAPSKGFGDNTAGKKRKKQIYNFPWKFFHDISLVVQILSIRSSREKERERELVQQYRDRLNYSLGFISARSFGRDSCESGAVKKIRGGRGKITMDGGGGRGMHL